MGKTWRNNAKNEGWRKAKQQKQNKWNQSKPKRLTPLTSDDDRVVPLTTESTIDNFIGGPDDYAYGM